jgi:predicted phage tail protein
MLIKLHGKFAEDYPGEFNIEAHTVAEAIDGWSRQIGFYEDLVVDDRPIARVVGCYTDEDLAAPTEQKVIHIVPAMIGGGGNFGKILIGAALIASVFVLPGIGIGLSAAMQGALLGAGIGMALGGVMGLFMKAPSLSKSTDPDASKYLGLSDNTTAIGTVIAYCMGEVPVNGQVLALNVDSNNMVVGTFPASPT